MLHRKGKLSPERLTHFRLSGQRQNNARAVAKVLQKTSKTRSPAPLKRRFSLRRYRGGNLTPNQPSKLCSTLCDGFKLITIVYGGSGIGTHPDWSALRTIYTHLTPTNIVGLDLSLSSTGYYLIG